ncbi:MAG TPA: NAD(+)/NADH kinase [Solirubrobacterales bacterium]|nr:NAD(+)/NADH kinase [Solirubrobacterales bacterium]
MTRAMLITHTHPEAPADATSAAVAAAAQAAKDASVQLISTPDELHKHGDAAAGIEAVEDGERPDVCIVLGGDGSILYALRRFAGTDVPVFGVNYGTVGFLAAVERDQLEEGLRRAYSGDFVSLDMPALRADLPIEGPLALNDFSFNRRPHGRVAELSYAIGGEEVGSVRCDGLVAATPAGSTGYNLANAGPILAWGVKGYVVSFIAPHTLAARALVVAPDDALQVRNAAGREPVEISLDGEAAGELEPGDALEIRFEESVSRLAQLPGSSFYHRIREKFGKLA